MKTYTLIFLTILFLSCAKPYYNYSSLTSQSHTPTYEISVYLNENMPIDKYYKIGEIVVNGGDYAFRLKKTIQMAKNSGGNGIIVRADKIDVNYEENSMISFVIRFSNPEGDAGKDEIADDETFDEFEFAPEEEFDEEYFLEETGKQEIFEETEELEEMQTEELE